MNEGWLLQLNLGAILVHASNTPGNVSQEENGGDRRQLDIISKPILSRGTGGSYSARSKSASTELVSPPRPLRKSTARF